MRKRPFWKYKGNNLRVFCLLFLTLTLINGTRIKKRKKYWLVKAEIEINDRWTKTEEKMDETKREI